RDPEEVPSDFRPGARLARPHRERRGHGQLAVESAGVGWPKGGGGGIPRAWVQERPRAQRRRVDRLRRPLRLLQANRRGAQTGGCIPVKSAAEASRLGPRGGVTMIRVIRGVLVVSVALLAMGSTTAVRAFAGEEEGENAPGLLPQVAAAKVSLEQGLAAAQTSGKP